MLVLERGLNQFVDVYIGNIKISVTISQIRNKSVRLGFEAPKEAVILRREVGNKK